MTMFEQTPTGYRATAEAVAYWRFRDTCPGCGTVTEPNGKLLDGRRTYRCPCNGDPVEWSAFSPADCR